MASGEKHQWHSWRNRQRFLYFSWTTCRLKTSEHACINVTLFFSEVSFYGGCWLRCELIAGVFRTVQVFMCVGFGVAFVVFLLILGLLFMLVGMDNRKHLLFGTVVAIFLQGSLIFSQHLLHFLHDSVWSSMILTCSYKNFPSCILDVPWYFGSKYWISCLE